MATYPEDRFDELPPDLLRVGAHRAPVRKGRGWIGFGWAVLATVLLTVVGLVGLAALDSKINFDLPFFQGQETPTPSPTPTPTAQPTIDPALPIRSRVGRTRCCPPQARCPIGAPAMRASWNTASAPRRAQATTAAMLGIPIP